PTIPALHTRPGRRHRRAAHRAPAPHLASAQLVPRGRHGQAQPGRAGAAGARGVRGLVPRPHGPLTASTAGPHPPSGGCGPAVLRGPILVLMYFTDRGIEELEKRRGEEEVTFEWLAEQLRTFVDLDRKSTRLNSSHVKI